MAADPGCVERLLGKRRCLLKHPNWFLPQALEEAREAAQQAGLPYAGGVPPELAWRLFSAGEALLVDVRSGEERKLCRPCAGQPACGLGHRDRADAQPALCARAGSQGGRQGGRGALLCRSGKRSALAAEAAAKAGFSQVFNVLEGFEGEIDARQHRGAADGWRFGACPGSRTRRSRWLCSMSNQDCGRAARGAAGLARVAKALA